MLVKDLGAGIRTRCDQGLCALQREQYVARLPPAGCIQESGENAGYRLLCVFNDTRDWNYLRVSWGKSQVVSKFLAERCGSCVPAEAAWARVASIELSFLTLPS